MFRLRIALIALTAALAACTQMPPPQPLTLATNTVQILGANARLEKTAAEEHVGWWENTDTEVKWTAKNVPAGAYLVNVVYALHPDFAGSTIAVTAGGKKFQKKLEPTKNWDDYQAVTLGSINVGWNGEAVITVKALDKPKRFVMNLRQIVLNPAPQ